MSTRSYQPGDSYGIGFTVKAASGALANADALPTAVLYHNGAVDGTVAVAVTSNATGDYSASCTLPGSYAPGDRCSLKVLATIGGVATGEYVDHIRLVGWPNTVGSAGCLPTVGTGAGQINPDGAGRININLAQAGLSPRALDQVNDSALTVGDALVAAICGAAGQEVVNGTSYVVSTPHTATPIRGFTLNSSTAPTSRS